MNFIFIINDLDLGSKVIKAEDILDTLLTNTHWLLTPTTPKLRFITRKSKVFVYLAGKDRRFFCAYFEIGGNVEQHKLTGTNDTEMLLFKMFHLSVPIKNIQKFQTPLAISDVKDKLDFITDKKNYGLFFRQSTKLIEEPDFQVLLDACKALNPSLNIHE